MESRRSPLWNTVAWTLSCEAAFYFAVSWLIRLPWPKTPSRLIAILLGIWALGLVPHTLYLWLNPDHLPAPADRYSTGVWIRTLKYTPLAYQASSWPESHWARFSRTTLTQRHRAMIAGASLLALAVFFATADSRCLNVMHGGLLVPLFAALVIGLSGRDMSAAAFAWKPIELLGQASYALFLLHFNFINLLRHYHVPERLHLPHRSLDILRGHAPAGHRGDAMGGKACAQGHPAPAKRSRPIVLVTPISALIDIEQDHFA